MKIIFPLKFLINNFFSFSFIIFFCKAGSFLLLPVYWHYLSLNDLGIIGVCTIVISFLITISSLGFQDVLLRFYSEWRENNVDKKLGLLWISLFLWGLACAIFFSLIHNYFNFFFVNISSLPYFLLSIWASFFAIFINLQLALYRILNNNKSFTIFTLLIFVTQSVLILFLIIYFSLGSFGYLLGILISNFLWAVVFFFLYWKKAKFYFNFNELNIFLKYSLPIMPSSIIDSMNNLLDRFFIDKYNPLASLGLYNVANQFGSILVVTNQGFKTAWFPFLYQIIQIKKRANDLLSKFSLLYTIIFLLPVLIISVLSKDIILFFAKDYIDSYQYVPWICLTIYFQAIASSMGRGFDLVKKNYYWLIISSVHIISTILLLSNLVPTFGVLGAAWSICISFFIRTLIQVFLANYVYPRELYIFKLLILWLISFMIFYFANTFDYNNIIYNLFLKCLFILFFYFASIFLTFKNEFKQIIYYYSNK